MKKSSYYVELVCPQCGKTFKPKHSKQFRCSFECSKLAIKNLQNQKRQKHCPRCNQEFYDDSCKNSRYLCPKCEIRGFDSLVLNLRNYHSESQRYSEEILLQCLSEIRKNEKFFGRLGETLFLYLYPDSRDMNLEESNLFPYDFEHVILGRVDVKVCQPTERLGSRSWAFQKHDKKDCDYLFCFGCSFGFKTIEKIWLIPRDILFAGAKCICYDSVTVCGDKRLLRYASFEVTHLYDLLALNLYLGKLLKVQPKWAYDLTKLTSMIPLWKGRLGELIFLKLHPQAKDMLIASGIDSPYDFEDSVFGKVDVKTSAYNNEGCFTFKRKELKYREMAENYFFVGLDRSYTKILFLFLIPGEVVRSLIGNLRLVPKCSYDVTPQYDLSKVDIMAIRNGKW